MPKTLPRIALAATLAAAALPALAQQAAQQEGSWMVRGRVMNLGMANKSTAGTGTIVTPALLPADSIAADNKTIPEVDITYFFSKNWAAELVLTIPQKDNVRITQGALAEPLGNFKFLPPTLSLQYHFMPDANFRPYVGVGINYTKISGVSLNSTAGGPLSLEKSSTGLSWGAGFDYKLAPKWFLNVDARKMYIESDVFQNSNGQKISTLKLDPFAVSLGIGYRF